MVDYGMKPAAALRAATSVAAKVLHMENQLGPSRRGCSPISLRSKAIRRRMSRPCAKVKLVVKDGFLVP